MLRIRLSPPCAPGVGCGVELLTCGVMGNPFHALVRVRDKETWMLQFEGARGEEKKESEAENEEGRKSGKRVRHGVSLEKRVEVLKKRGGMSVGALLRCRVRYFSDGAVMGSREFVGEHRRRGEDDERRVPRVKELAGGLVLRTMRGLRVNAVRRKGGG